MRRTAVSLAAGLLGLGLLTACGDTDTPAAASQEPKVIQVQVDGSTISPAGERVEVGVGQPVELDITADAAGEIHVHSDPEQELEYAAGTSQVQIAPIDTPGVVEVESHSLDKVIVQLQVQ